MNLVRKLAVVIVALASASVAQADPILVSVGGDTYTIDTYTGSFAANQAALMGTAWWGNADLAVLLAAEVSDRLGTPNPFVGLIGDTLYLQLVGPYFAVSLDSCSSCFPADAVDSAAYFEVPVLAFTGVAEHFIADRSWIRTYAVVGAVSVPEPGTLALLGIGLFGMGLARRRKA